MNALYVLAIALTAISFWPTTSANAEKWSCEMEMPKGKTYKQEWIVSNDRMFAPKGKGYLRVLLNNTDTLLAFLTMYTKDRTPANHYVMISKSTGVLTEIQELVGLDFGPQSQEWISPVVEIGHCSSLERP
jgi:hypothetical protein